MKAILLFVLLASALCMGDGSDPLPICRHGRKNCPQDGGPIPLCSLKKCKNDPNQCRINCPDIVLQ